MKFHQSRVLNNLELFDRTIGLGRHSNDMYLLWKVCEFFQPKKILEIGFLSGQSLGILYEASNKVDVISVDVDYTHRAPFDQLFPDTNIKFIHDSSMNLSLSEQFDFVHIDGDHTYEYVSNDIQKVLPLLHNNSILCMDDFKDSKCPGVGRAVKEYLLGQHGFVPFLSGDQEMFFHHISHSADHFLDSWIQEKSNNFIYFHNYDYCGFTVLESKTPNLFRENHQMFIDALKFYNL